MKLTRHDDFVAHVCELLEPLGTVHAKRMFGGWCLYVDAVPMALIARDTLWFKVDAGNRGAYEAAGTAAFQPFPDKPMVMSYWQVPATVMEDRRSMAEWGRQALEAAVRSAKPARVRRPSGGARRERGGR